MYVLLSMVCPGNEKGLTNKNGELGMRSFKKREP